MAYRDSLVISNQVSDTGSRRLWFHLLWCNPCYNSLSSFQSCSHSQHTCGSRETCRWRQAIGHRACQTFGGCKSMLYHPQWLADGSSSCLGTFSQWPDLAKREERRGVNKGWLMFGEGSFPQVFFVSELVVSYRLLLAKRMKGEQPSLIDPQEDQRFLSC